MREALSWPLDNIEGLVSGRNSISAPFRPRAPFRATLISMIYLCCGGIAFQLPTEGEEKPEFVSRDPIASETGRDGDDCRSDVATEGEMSRLRAAFLVDPGGRYSNQWTALLEQLTELTDDSRTGTLTRASAIGFACLVGGMP
jgi:hypothetical protein